MINLIKIPALTCSLLFLSAQPSFAQSGSRPGTGANTGVGAGTNSGAGTTTGANTDSDPMTRQNSGNTSGTNRGTGTNRGVGTNIGNDSDISGGTTNAHSKNDNPKTVKDSRHCSANEDFVKQGDHMICVPRTNNDTGTPMGKER